MRRSPELLAVATVAALAGWVVRGIPAEPPPAAPPPPAVRAPSSTPPSAAEPAPGVIHPGEAAAAHDAGRNLFAYVSHREPAAFTLVGETPPAAAKVTVIAPPPLREPAEPPRQRFPYRYIGRFGPAHNQVAAFAGDGEVLTARPGDRVGATFRLKAIRDDFVEVVGATHSEKVGLRDRP